MTFNITVTVAGQSGSENAENWIHLNESPGNNDNSKTNDIDIFLSKEFFKTAQLSASNMRSIFHESTHSLGARDRYDVVYADGGTQRSVNITHSGFEGNIMGTAPGELFDGRNLHQMLLWMSGRGWLSRSGHHKINENTLSGDQNRNGW